MSDNGDGTDAIPPVEELPVPPESSDPPAVNGGDLSSTAGAEGGANKAEAGKSEPNGHNEIEAEPPVIGAIASENEALRKFCRDVLLPHAESSETRTAINDARDASFSIAGKPLRAVLAPTSKLWNLYKDPIPFVFLPGDWVGNEVQHNKVRQIIKEWEKYGSFAFKEAAEENWDSRYGNRIIRITFDDREDSEDAGSWSTIGTDCTLVSVKRATMNFGWVHGENARITADEKAVILHEFGHALGMLHEHQSMAGGGIPLANVREAIRYYHTYNPTWDEATVMQQVVTTYNIKDVSSFSKVDRTSIMHYPQPKSVTGLPYDIPYNYNLSDIDKAYMRIMYPSNDPNEDTLKVLRAALVAIGMVKSDPDAADKILELGAKADPAGVVDPSQIRDIFSAWCRRTIPVTVISEDGSPTTGGGSHGVQPSKDTGAKSIDLSEITVRFTKGSMCSTKSQSSKTLISSSGRAQGTEPSRLRAVTSPKVLQKRWPLDQIAVKPDNKDYRVPATYSIAPCPISKAKGVETIDPTDYRVKLVKDALEEWAKYASIDFIQMAHPSESDAKLDDPRHLAIVFQDYHYSTGNHFTLNGDDYRSYTNFKTQVITPPPENIYTPEEFKSEMELHEASPPIKHTICIRGVIDNEEEGSKPAPNIAQVLAGIIVTNEMVAVRTITHEIGHWLGLEHENVGAYGAFIFENQHDEEELFKLMVAYKSTKVDTGSVMDVMTEPELLEEWKAAMSPKAAFRTVLTLSPIDKANIAFTHPGKALSPDLIEAYCKGLQYSEKTIVSLTQLYQAGDLAAFRAAHHTALQEQEDAWWVALDKDVNEEMKKILGNRLHTPIPTSRGAESVDLSGITVRLTKGPMCATKSSSSQVPSSRAGKARTAEPARMRAVTSLDLLEKRWPLRQITAQAENKDFRVRATYSIAPCPIYKAKDAEVINPTDYRFQLVRDSLDEWSRYASIDFTLIAHPAETDARLDDIKHLTIVFQDYLYTTGIPIPLNDYLYQSYTYDKTQIPSPPLADDFEADEVEEYNREMKDFETCPPVKHTMCLRGIPNTADLGSQPAADIAQYVPGVVITTEMVARRTIMHEIGHWLGLDHEDVGAYGGFIFENERDAARLKDLMLRCKSTRIDTGSIMDSFIIPQLLQHWIDTKSLKGVFRTVLTPSPVDIANIAFTHPGKTLTPALIVKYGKALQYSDETIATLTEHYQAGDLAAIRTTHHNALESQEAAWTEGLSKDVDDEIRKILDSRTHAVNPAPILRADPNPNASAPSSKYDAGLLGAVYTALSNAFGPQGSQFLTLQFPTRYLSKDEFAFDLNGVYSNFVKPVTVAEAEARLVDALYDPAPIVGGPNGKSLSAVYGQALNNLVPRYEPEDRPAREQRERMRAWLLTEIGDQNPFYKLEVNTATGGQVRDPNMSEAANKALLASNAVKMRKMTRMEFANQLTQDYLDAQTAWEMERESLVNKAITTKDQVELETVTRKLVHITAAQQNKLSMKYADSVVRGYSHIVREALGQLDVSTSAENLQDAKDSFRASALASLYSASKVLPVLMSPIDWAASLDTSFTAEDLADSPDLVIMTIQSKSAQLDNYKSQLALLQGAVDGDPATLKAAVESAARNLDKAEAALNSKYLDSTIELAKIIISIATDGASDAGGKLGEMQTELEGSVKKLDPMGTVEDIGKQISAVGDAQRALQQATSVYASKSAALARAEATDTRTEQASIQRSIDALTVEIASLRARLSAATSASKKLKALEDANPTGMDVKTLASAATNKVQGGSRWQTIFVTRKMKYKQEDSETMSDFSMSRWSCNFWIGSAGGSNERSEATAKTSNLDRELDIEISMKVTLVTVDRSGWFQPQILENSGAFMQNNSNYRFARYPSAFETLAPADMAKKIRDELVPPSFPADCQLPSFVSGLILCKDVTIKVSNMNLSSETDKRHFLEKSESSGGFLFFHYNRASEHQEDSSHATFNFANDGMIVKIPGPQILGYIQQLAPQDKSTKFDVAKSLASEFYLPPELSTDLAKNTESSSNPASGREVVPGRSTVPRSNSPSSVPAGFQFEVGKTTMTPKTGEAHKESAKPEVVKGAQPPAAEEPSVHIHDGTISDIFKHIADTLQTSDDTLKSALKKWLDSSSSSNPDLGPSA